MTPGSGPGPAPSVLGRPIPRPVPTAIAEIELSEPVSGLDLDARYEQAFLVLRYQGRPVGQATLPLTAGRLDAAEIERALVESCGWPLWRARLEALSGGVAQPPPAPAATIAVCTRDRPRDLERCLQSIMALVDDGQEVLVVDSASRAATTLEVAARYPGVRAVRAERPGLDVARNLALVHARTELLAFIDDDAEVESNWLRALLHPFSTDDLCLVSTGLVLPAQLDAPAQFYFEQHYGFGRGYEPRLFDLANTPVEQAWRCGVGASMAMRRRTVLEDFGGFDEALGAGTATRGGDDNDLFARALANGGHVHYRPDAVAWHWHDPSLENLRRKFFSYGLSWFPFLLRRLTREHRWAALPAMVRSLRSQTRRFVRSATGRPGTTPARFLAAELAGWLAGPVADLRARRGVQPPRPRRKGRLLGPAASAPAEEAGRPTHAEPAPDLDRLAQLDLALGLDHAREAVEEARPSALLARLGGEVVGLLVERAPGEGLRSADLDRALRGAAAYGLLGAWSERGELLGTDPPWMTAALRRWFASLGTTARQTPDGFFVEHHLQPEARYRHLQNWMRVQQDDKLRLERLAERARERADRAAARLAELDRTVETLSERLAELARLRRSATDRPGSLPAGGPGLEPGPGEAT